jgi:hypothetical protein
MTTLRTSAFSRTEVRRVLTCLELEEGAIRADVIDMRGARPPCTPARILVRFKACSSLAKQHASRSESAWVSSNLTNALRPKPGLATLLTCSDRFWLAVLLAMLPPSLGHTSVCLMVDSPSVALLCEPMMATLLFGGTSTTRSLDKHRLKSTTRQLGGSMTSPTVRTILPPSAAVVAVVCYRGVQRLFMAGIIPVMFTGSLGTTRPDGTLVRFAVKDLDACDAEPCGPNAVSQNEYSLVLWPIYKCMRA